jgi:hypothetical protein
MAKVGLAIFSELDENILHIVDKLPLQFKATHADNNPDDSL